MATGSRTTSTDQRSSIQIVADVLRAARYEGTKSCVFRQANLNHMRGERYLEFCTGRGLLEETGDGFDVTRKGRSFLSDWSHLEDYLVKVEENLDYR